MIREAPRSLDSTLSAARASRSGSHKELGEGPDEGERAHRRHYSDSLSRVDIVLSLHGRIAFAIVLYLSAVGLWGLALGIRGLGPTPSFVGALVIAEIAAIVQGLFGLALLFSRPPANSLHILYGFALSLALPLAATLVRKRERRTASLTFAVVALFAAGLAIRGMTTA